MRCVRRMFGELCITNGLKCRAHKRVYVLLVLERLVLFCILRFIELLGISPSVRMHAPQKRNYCRFEYHILYIRYTHICIVNHKNRLFASSAFDL